jgi:hypothetical protein
VVETWAPAIIAGLVAVGGSGSATWLVLRERLSNLEAGQGRIEKKVDQINGRVRQTEIDVAEMRGKA